MNFPHFMKLNHKRTIGLIDKGAHGCYNFTAFPKKVNFGRRSALKIGG